MLHSNVCPAAPRRVGLQGKGKSQAVVAGVTEDYLSQIERGLKAPTVSLLHRFSKINAATGELLRELTLNPARSYQPTGAPRGRARPRQPPAS